ncbi:MAG TPA: 3-hydroxyacyl-ACP dehydratase FabZ family protein [Gemmatimonadaceae bacterium]|nr:3-hydroxyacyl-ACP dehydratase FabZ family protein [Gemmatimonadaceae bacterium]
MTDEVLESPALHALLAHRFPFLLVDRVRIVEPGRRVVGTKLVSAGEWWCDPRTPTTAAMPFSLVIEALAQTSGALLRDLTDGAPGVLAYFMGADQVRLRRPARPGDELTLAVMLQQWRRGICRTRAVATVEGALVARALLTIVVRGTG